MLFIALELRPDCGFAIDGKISFSTLLSKRAMKMELSSGLKKFGESIFFIL